MRSRRGLRQASDNCLGKCGHTWCGVGRERDGTWDEDEAKLTMAIRLE